MKDFGYCIWLVSNDENNVWEFKEKGFKTHLTIFKNLSYSASIKLFLSLEKQSIILEKKSLPKPIQDDGFYSLQYPIYFSDLNKTKKPGWWPNDAHISINYNYDEPFLKVKDNLNLPDKCEFNDIVLMKCIGHYSKWEKIL